MDVTYNLYNIGVSRPADNEEGGGEGSSRPCDKEGGGCLQNFGPQFGLKKRGAVSSPGSATVERRYLYQYGA